VLVFNDGVDVTFPLTWHLPGKQKWRQLEQCERTGCAGGHASV